MNTFVRTSNVKSINQIRKYLWENVYSKFPNLDRLVRLIGDEIKNNYSIEVECFQIDFQSMSMNIIFTQDIIYDDNLITCIHEGYKKYVQETVGKLEDEEMNTIWLNNYDRFTIVTFKGRRELIIGL